MKTLLLPALAAALLASGFAVPADAQSRSDQSEARKQMKAGHTLKLRDIERRVLPTMGDAEYLGPAYDSTAMAYRLKFIRDGRVIFVDIDARTGQILRRTR